MFPNRIDDPRDDLLKARRTEIVQYARLHGIAEITPEMPAIVMRKILRQKGINKIPIPKRTLGFADGFATSREPISVELQAPNAGPSITIDADDLMESEFQHQQQLASDDPRRMKMGELRSACKVRGIKMDRRDNLITLQAKLKAHGQQNPA